MTVDRANGLPDILPTHACFDDALDFFTELDGVFARSIVDMHDQFRVVHGVCRGHARGTLYAHAWVEDENNTDGTAEQPPLVWQAGVRRVDGKRVWFGLPRDRFYELYGVQYRTRYTVPMCAELNRTHGTYGPWRPEYVALCQETGEGRVVGMMSGIGPAVIICPSEARPPKRKV